MLVNVLIFFVSADILMGCARQKVTIRIAIERRGDAASRFFFFFPHTSGWISAIDRYMDTSMSYKHTHTHMQISMAIRALSNKVDIL